MRINDNAHDWVWLEDIPSDFAYCERCHVCVRMFDLENGHGNIKKGARRYTYEQAVKMKIKHLEDIAKGNQK